MLNKVLLASIVLDKKKLKIQEKGSCISECIPTIKLLSEEEQDEVKQCLDRVCELLRKSYIMMRGQK